MRFYFARHGESQANLLHVISNRNLPHHLTEAGREQARKLAERLRGNPIRCLYTSPLLRAQETSAIIAGILELDYKIADGLREYDCGVAEGHSDQAAWQLWQAEYDAWVFTQDYDYQIEGGERFWDVRQRFESFINTVTEASGGSADQILCISHGGIYSVMLPLILQNISPLHLMKLGFDYTSCIVAEHRAGGLVCIEWNGQAV